MKQPFSDRKGFTLMEMVMVLVVVGLLVSIIVPKFTTQLDNAKEAATRANLESLRSAVGLYARQVGTNPKDLSNLLDPIGPNSVAILRSVPNDAWGYPFDYVSTTGEVSCGTGSPCELLNW